MYWLVGPLSEKLAMIGVVAFLLLAMGSRVEWTHSRGCNTELCYVHLALVEISAISSDSILVVTINLFNHHSYHSHYQSTLVFCKDPILSTSVSPR